MTKRIASALLLAAALLQPTTAAAQDRWSFELRGNGSFGKQLPASDEVKGGLGFEGTIRYRFMPHLAAYAGWDWVHFTADPALVGSDQVEETGYVFGLRFEHPLGNSATALWLRAGGTYDHLELEDEDGEITADSGHGLGWEAGAGLALPIGRAWSLTPGIRYRSLSRDLEIGSTTVPAEMRYVAFELGFARSF